MEYWINTIMIINAVAQWVTVLSGIATIGVTIVWMVQLVTMYRYGNADDEDEIKIKNLFRKMALIGSGITMIASLVVLFCHV